MLLHHDVLPFETASLGVYNKRQPSRDKRQPPPPPEETQEPSATTW
jgi:hypothetical protein